MRNFLLFAPDNMIGLFNTNHPVVYINLMVLSLITRLSVLLNANQLAQHIDILDFEVSINWVATWIAEAVVTMIAGLLLNYLLVDKQVIGRRNHLAAFAFITISSFGTFGTSMLAQSVSLLLLIIALINFSSLKAASTNVAPLFFGGFFIALSSLVVPEFLLVLLFMGYVLTDVRDGLMRGIFLCFLGALTTLYFFWTGYFLFDRGFIFIDTYLSSFKLHPSEFQISGAALLKWVTLSVYGLFCLFSIGSSESWKNVQPRKWLTFFVVITIVPGLASLVFGSSFGLVGTISMCLAGMISSLLLPTRRKAIRQFIALAMVVSAVIYQLLATKVFIGF